MRTVQGVRFPSSEKLRKPVPSSENIRESQGVCALVHAFSSHVHEYGMMASACCREISPGGRDE